MDSLWVRSVPVTLPFDDPDELGPEELARLHRKTVIKRMIVVVVVIAMIATLLVPIIVRVVRAPSEPESILADQAPIASRRMSP